MDLYNSYVEIDCEKICMNIRSIQAQAGALTEVIPVLKCDAYGLGAGVIAREIARGTDVRTFAVAQVGEAAALRDRFGAVTSERQRARLEAAVSAAFVSYARDLQSGAIVPS